VVKLKIRTKEEDEEDEAEADVEEVLQSRIDVLSTLMKDVDVSSLVKTRKSIIPLDSHKIDFGRVPSSLAEYIERSVELQLMIEEMLSNSDEEIRFLESYNILTKLRISSAVEGWLLRMILGRGGTK